MNKIKELINELNKASELYYNGQESFLTDKEFDIKLEELKKLEQKQKIIYSNSPTVNVGAPVLTELNKVQIKDKPMLSLDKVHSAKEIVNFSDGYDLVASIKCDGLSVRLIYQDTDLISANTRGNGYEGSDITEHIKHFLNVPLKIAKTGTYIIDGEAIIYDKDFAIINTNNEFKNNRNTASGALALLDMSIVENRKMSFVAWDVIKGAGTNWYHYNLEEAEEMGFTVVPAVVLECTKIEEEEINQINEDLILEAKLYYGIPCDGVVWRINNIDAGNEKGQTEHHFLNAVAWKPLDDEYETELLDIEWGMGRTNILTPVAIFKPIEIDGTIIERASLHNYSVLVDTLGKEPYLHQPIWVIKSNQIIPQITRAIKNDIPQDLCIGSYPLVCPVCGEPIQLVTSDTGVINVCCMNNNCQGKLVNKIDHYVGKKGLNINGLSEKTIEKLIDWGWINSIKDIYTLKDHKVEWINKPGFGDASVIKILEAIEESKNCTLDHFIAALGIPEIGTKAAKDIASEFKTWDQFRSATAARLLSINGIGEVMVSCIFSFDYTNADYIYKNYINIKEAKAAIGKNLNGKTFVVTGKVHIYKNRDELSAKITSLGGEVKSSVSSKTDYLINNDINSTSSKNVKAKELNIPIITEEQFEEMIT